MTHMLKARERANLNTTKEQIKITHITWNEYRGDILKESGRFEVTTMMIEVNTTEMLASMIALNSLT